MINFNENSIFNLHKIDNSKLNKNVAALMIDGEELIGVYSTVRDQVVFTNKRILAVDVEGVGVKQEITTLPYSKISFFHIQTAGLLELLPDSELCIHFSNEYEARFEFRGTSDILKIGKTIGQYIL